MLDEKMCQACGRPMTYRKKWSQSWDEVKYCSKACRRRGVPEKLMADVLNHLYRHDLGSTFCPSDVLEGADKTCKQKIERVREAARLLAHQGKIVIIQKGKPVDHSSFKGPIELRLRAGL